MEKMVPPVLMLSENGIFPILRICGSIFLRLGTVICLQADRTSMFLSGMYPCRTRYGIPPGGC